ncbi:hypothetical protein [Streptomyces sp. NPDC093261]|uniref:hypothetical protein n=1 Tax=Streptomyces sp. NPDC093261 TaxID=3366037 RepID=UPI00380CECCF
MTARLLCLHCRNVTEVDPDGEPLRCCPGCQSTGVPADADDTVTLTLTTHELRVLTIWASNWAEAIKHDSPDAPTVIYGILDEAGRTTSAALSMRQEIADLRAMPGVGEVTVYRSDGTVTDL